MKGIINKGIKELIEQRFGAEAWEQIKQDAGCDEPFFAVGLDYPDQQTLDLVTAAAGVAGISPRSAMLEYGKFVVPHTFKATYPSFFKLAGDCPRQLLLNVGKIHERVTRNIAGARPPRFECEELADGRLRMHYDSDRGLCAVACGLILGVGLLFGQELGVTETACKHRGDPRCTLEVTFP
jgi:Haem-NO-binding